MKKTLVGVALAATAAYAGWQWMHDGDDAPAVGDESKLVLDRLWIDHLPRHERDTVQVFVALTEEPYGIFQQVAQWKGAHEIFRFEAHGDELRVVYPHTGEREKLKARARKCNEHGMDYCLELKGASRGVKKYYSLEDWVIDGASDATALERRARGMVERLSAGR
jgi:hypothetical protein